MRTFLVLRLWVIGGDGLEASGSWEPVAGSGLEVYRSWQPREPRRLNTSDKRIWPDRCNCTSTFRKGFPGALICIKLPKASSSTFCGIIRRVGCKNGYRGAMTDLGTKPPGPSIPAIHATHARYANEEVRIWLATYKRKNPFVLSSVREPASRCMSHYYHNLMHGNLPFISSKIPNMDTVADEAEAVADVIRKSGFTKDKLDQFKVEYSSKSCNNYQFTYLKKGNEAVRETIARYQFLLVVERYEESLFILAHHLRVPLSHVLYIASKESDKQKARTSLMRHVPMSQESKRVQSFFRGHFLEQNRYDMQLYRQANSRLDQLRASLDTEYGKENVTRRIVAFKNVIQVTEKTGRPSWRIAYL